MNRVKSKKSLVSLLLDAILGTVGVTIAYFTSTDIFANDLATKWTKSTEGEKLIITS